MASKSSLVNRYTESSSLARACAWSQAFRSCAADNRTAGFGDVASEADDEAWTFLSGELCVEEFDFRMVDALADDILEGRSPTLRGVRRSPRVPVELSGSLGLSFESLRPLARRLRGRTGNQPPVSGSDLLGGLVRERRLGSRYVGLRKGVDEEGTLLLLKSSLSVCPSPGFSVGPEDSEIPGRCGFRTFGSSEAFGGGFRRFGS